MGGRTRFGAVVPLMMVVALASAGIASVAPASAGIVDSPLPVIAAGKKTVYVYTIPGVVNLANVGTYISCTSASKSTEGIAVEVFGPFGGDPVNDATLTASALVPGATIMFGTEGAAGIVVDRNLGLGTLHVGSARILATTKAFICTAYLADTGGNPPTSMTYLTIVAKTTQKAAN